MSQTQTVLLAHADPEVMRLLSESLIRAGMNVIRAQSGEDALEIVRQCLPSLVILEVALPKIQGSEVLRTLKADQVTSEVRVVMLASARDEVDSIVCFELGADDYVTKPFSPRELTLRVKAILARRIELSSSRYASVGNITLDREGREVRVLGKQVDLTVREYYILDTFFRQPGRVFSREELLALVWGEDSTVEIRTVDTHLRRLRERLGSAALQIRTVRGFGYRLEGL